MQSRRLVGALFSHDTRGEHFCTASPVAAPSRNLLITAAHCLHEGEDGGYLDDLVYVPAYRDGHAPYGVWKAGRLLVGKRWAHASDPDLDVGFVVLRPLHGKEIGDVVGANRLGVDQGYRNVVRVTGYPSAASEPITCVNRTRRKSEHQVSFACKGFRAGTSGSPWLTRPDPLTGTGVVVGVVGGFQHGGKRDAISYSAYFDDNVESLYAEAVREAARTG